MARAKNAGLGRGLNSLLSGTYEDTAIEKPKNTSTPPAPVPVPEVKAPEEPMKEGFEEVKEEHVTIKGVVTREADASSTVKAKPKPSKSALPRETDAVPISMIKPNPDQPRTSFKREEIEELAASIDRAGLLQPILVRPLEDGTYQIIAGERRWQACRLIGMKSVPVRIKQADDNEALEFALVENIQRTDLNPIEEAYGYKRMMERQGLTQSELAQKISKGRSTIANALRLLDLPEDAQQLLFEEKITAGHARAILAVPTAAGRQKLTEKLVNEKLSVRETENIARLLANKPPVPGFSKRTPTPKTFKKVAKSLKNVLATPVRVKTVQGKNKIEIEFKDEADLERIYKLMTEKG
ncbi:MAG: ParB/RepB/Spo0J family partition protein [Eggerthellaceae bacterium]|nr:ParB/RepB/Spo0J family partition protein [Eggerthellaceae bacterium]